MTRLRLAAELGSLPVLLLLFAPAARAATALPGQGDDTGRIVLYRDTFGVAHIYAPTVEGGLYAMGWGQAEDRPEQLLLNMLMGIGEYASAVGKEGVDVDLRSRLFDHYGIAKRGFPGLRPELRAGITSFVAGINDFYAAHPKDMPEWFRGRRVDEAMVLACGRMFLFNWSIDEAYGDLRRAGIEPGFEAELRGSNQFAIAPSRSAEGVPILAIDPHLSWYGPSRYWEVRIHAGALEGSGVSRAGSPYLGLGHTRNLAWAMTTGGPDTADIYALKLDETGERYRYDGGWRALERRDITIAVRGEATPRRQTLWFSHHGPIVARRGADAWAARIAYHDVATAFEAIYELNFGADYHAAERAMALRVLFPQNVMVADTSGNIYYQRTGRVPKRAAGLDPSLPLDGTTAATEWQGLHESSDHLQVANPPQGFMQNCNIPPDAMMPNSPFRLDRTNPYLFASLDYGPRRDGWTNQRGARAIELLAADDSVTAEEAMAILNDIRPIGAGRWIEALRAADARSGAPYSLQLWYTPARDALFAWTGSLDANSSEALVYAYFREQIELDLGADRAREFAGRIDDLYAVVEQRPPRPLALDAEADEVLLGALARAARRLVANHGSFAATYGDRFRVGRGERSWPVEGGGGQGTTTLRNMGYTDERPDHTRWGRSGQTSTQIVVLSKPPRSWGYLPLGESDRSESPHFSDLAEKAFSPRRLQPSWWLPEDLAGHIESRTVLTPAH